MICLRKSRSPLPDCHIGTPHPLTSQGPGSTAKEVGLSIEAADYTHSYIWVPGEGFQRLAPLANARPTSKYLNSKWHGMELPVFRELEKHFPDKVNTGAT